MEKKTKSDSAKLGAEERLEALLAATERPDDHLLTLTLPASTIALGQAGGLVREALAQARAEKVTALREVANIIEDNWAQLGTRTLILKTIRDRATALETKLAKQKDHADDHQHPGCHGHALRGTRP